MKTSLQQALTRIERLITRDAESLTDPQERQAEFDRRLERTRRLVTHLDDPEQDFDIIHIGGTSGKGSIAMLCESILLAAGRHVGTHTTPYLQTPLEKVRVNGRLITPEALIALTTRVQEAVDTLRQFEDLGAPHYAEAWLGLALRHFADCGVDVGVIEVGMGGRFDCTNIVVPRVSVINTVHYDHVRVLGDELAEIAYHKAGIIKPGVPVVIGRLSPVASRVVEDEARRNGARLIRLGKDLSFKPLSVSRHGGRFTYHGLHRNLENVEIGLLGKHQFANTAVALAALETYEEATGTPISEDAIRAGLAQVRFAGRLEIMQNTPLVVLDGAHNEEKVEALVAALPELFQYERLVMVLGMLETKNADTMMHALTSLADVIVTTEPHVKGKPAIDAQELARLGDEAGADETIVGGPPLEALQQALAITRPGDLLVVTGSLYLLGVVRSHWHTVDEIISAGTMIPNGVPDE